MEPMAGKGTRRISETGDMRLSMRPHRRKPGNGFSLIELMVVLALISIMTALIIPQMRGTFEDALLRSTGRKLVDAFTLASSRAITLNQLHVVRLDQKQHRYFVERNSRAAEDRTETRDVPGGEGELDSRITIEIQKADEDPSSEQEQRPPFVSGEDLGKNSRSGMISFYPDGTADRAELLLKDREGFRLALRINPITARVQITELERE